MVSYSSHLSPQKLSISEPMRQRVISNYDQMNEGLRMGLSVFDVILCC